MGRAVTSQTQSGKPVDRPTQNQKMHSTINEKKRGWPNCRVKNMLTGVNSRL